MESKVPYPGDPGAEKIPGRRNGNGSALFEAQAPSSAATSAAGVANPSPPEVEPHEPHTHWLSEARTARVRSADGVEIHYETLGSTRPDAPVIVLANGLGGRLYSWEPLVERFAPRARIITWDYRGLFSSHGIKRRKDLAIEKHALDVRAILDAERVSKATVVGWSMGVQVALEVATAFPERVEKLVLLNGTHGHTMETGLQPLFRFPWLPRLLHEGIDRVCSSERALGLLRKLGARPRVHGALGALYGRLRGNPKIEDVLRQYASDIFGPSFRNYLRLFQELDAHSVYHHLREIEQPALVVYGDLDPLTPAYQSREIARRMPRAEVLRFRFGTHFVLLEYPKAVVGRIEKFLGIK
jgi:pimeloyl-ACP methyl ester carboxylesterase